MSNLTRWEPFREVVSLRDAVNRLFDESLVRPFDHWPFAETDSSLLAVDVRETEEALIVEATLPGFEADDVDISVINQTLTIEAETKKDEEKEEAGKYYRRERYHGALKRTLTLPVDVDADKAKATFKAGTLTLTLPKVEAAKPKRIADAP